MNRIYVVVSFFLFTLLVTSCDNTLNLVEPGGNVAIVYGLIGSNIEKQYIRVEKGFIDPFVPAEEVAQNPDSLYYGPNEAEIRLVNVTQNKNFVLDRVEASDLGFQRDEGFFPTDPNYIYVHNGDSTDFAFGDRVRFELDRGDSEELVFAEINVLDRIIVSTPSSNDDINIPDLADFEIKWVTLGTAIPRFYSVNIYMTYKEANTEDEEPELETNRIKWEFGSVEDETSIAREGNQFFQFIQRELEADPKYVRTFEFFDIEIIYSGTEVKKYVDFLNANTGITSSQPIPPYSNLSEGLGLIGERNVVWVDRVFLREATQDSLINGRYTKDLGFL